MKKADLLKAGLATITMMVLSACGSGGGGDTPTTASTNTNNTPSATDKGSADKAAADKAAADKAAAEAAQKAQEAAKKAEEERLAKEAAAKEAKMKEEAAKKAAEELAKAKQEAEAAKKALVEAEKAKAAEKAAADKAAKEAAARLAAVQKAATDAADAAKKAVAALEAKLKAEKDAADKAEKDRLAAEKAEKDRLAAEKAAQDAANKAVLVDTKPVNIGESHLGYIHTRKNASDFDVQGTDSTKTDSKGNTALLMRDRSIFNKNLDNLVIAHNGNKTIYLQDLDLRTAKTTDFEVPDAKGNLVKVRDYDFLYRDAQNSDDPRQVLLSNRVNLKNVYASEDTQSRFVGVAVENDAANKNDPLTSITKTQWQGVDEGAALIHQTGRKIYIDHKDLEGIKSIALTENNRVANSGNGVPVLTPEGRLTNAPVGIDDFEPYNHKTRDAEGVHREGTNFEIYGHKTVDYRFKGAPNLPLVDKTLHYVQYGRATSKLSGRELSEYIGGLKTDSLIAQYGAYGAPDTENHFFARGADNAATTAAQVANLSNHYAGSKLTYEGHAVAYGLNNKYRDPNAPKDGIPTALINLPASEYLVSGNHIRANVDLNTKLVDGKVYNVWATFDPKKTDRPEKPARVETTLVGFNGTLAKNGNIAGDAVNYSANNAPGIFNATLYGAKAQEMGGTIVSAKPDESAWGLSFGAINVTAPKAAPAPAVAPALDNVYRGSFKPRSDLSTSQPASK